MTDDIKEIVFDSEKLAEYRKDRDDIDVVLDLMEFKWTLTSQIRANNEFGDRTDEWKRSITSLVIRVKSAIAEVRRDVRAAGRGKELDEAIDDLRDERDDDE